uniref:Cyclin C-terminal domain-containing protein n=1 Tax=Kalanchoe fedtschenkoi TaxID=63787 RepID=A0A7N1A944_KALFE
MSCFPRLDITFSWVHVLQQETTGWPMQLLSVACLSLAAKMEEPLVPTLPQLQVEGAKFIFESKTIRRMELLVLSVLDWKLRSITPFNFVDYFVEKLDSSGIYKVFLITRATEIILSIIREISFVEYLPSCIAATGVLCAGNEFPIFSCVNAELAESWCDGLNKETITGCYQLLQDSSVVVKSERKRALRVLPHLRVTTTSRASLRSSDESSSSSSSSSPFFKRRRLNGFLWVVDDDKGGSG